MKCAAAVVVLAVLCIGMISLGTETALGCSCGVSSAAELVTGMRGNPDALLFQGEEVAQRRDDGAVTRSFRVDRVYLGDFDGTELDASSLDLDCGGALISSGTAVFSALRVGEDYRLGVCGHGYEVLPVEALFDGLPTPQNRGPPGFVVAHDMLPSAVAVLNDEGRVIEYGPPGNGRVVAMALCPGAQAVAAVVDPTPFDHQSSAPLRIQVRSIPELEMIVDVETDASRDSRVLQDLECHEPAGGLVTFLAGERPWVGEPAEPRLGPAALHVLRDGAVSEVAVGPSRSVVVDPGEHVAHAVDGTDGRTVATWDIETGTLRTTQRLPASYSARHISLMAGGVRLLVASQPISGPYYPNQFEVDAVLTGSLDALEADQLAVQGPVYRAARTGGSVVGYIGASLAFFDADGNVHHEREVDRGSPRFVAFGSSVALARTSAEGSIGVYDPITDSIQPVTEVGFVTHAVALAQPSPADIPERAGPTEAAAAINDSGPVATVPPGNSARAAYLLAAGAVAFLALVMFVFLRAWGR